MNYIPLLTPLAIDRRQRWDYKAVAYLHGSQSQLGAFVVAMLGRKRPAPCFHPGGIQITADGKVLALYKGAASQPWEVAMLYESTQALTDTFLGLADALKLDDVQTTLMFEELRKFIVKDERVKRDDKGIAVND